MAGVGSNQYQTKPGDSTRSQRQSFGASYAAVSGFTAPPVDPRLARLNGAYRSLEIEDQAGTEPAIRAALVKAEQQVQDYLREHPELAEEQIQQYLNRGPHPGRNPRVPLPDGSSISVQTHTDPTGLLGNTTGSNSTWDGQQFTAVEVALFESRDGTGSLSSPSWVGGTPLEDENGHAGVVYSYVPVGDVLAEVRSRSGQ